MRGTERVSTLRVAGFALTVGGGALVVLGSLLDWVSVGLKSDASGALTTTTPGVDFRAGLVTMGLGIAALLGFVALRLVHSTPLRRLVAAGVILVGIGAAGIGIYEMSKDRDQFLFTALRPLQQQYHQEQGLPLNDQLAAKIRDQLRKDGLVELKIGIPVVIVGGLIATIGGVLDFAWAGARQREREGPPSAV
jgi:Tryptophan-associated transmembrane protein (Trp_oprn_chp)